MVILHYITDMMKENKVDALAKDLSIRSNTTFLTELLLVTSLLQTCSFSSNSYSREDDSNSANKMSAADGLEVDDVIQLLSILANDANLRVTVKESLKGGLITGVTAVIGGLIGGRIGLAIGAVAGGIGASAMADDFQGVGSILINMDREKKQMLFAKVQQCLEKASINDIGKLNEAIRDPEMKSKLLKVVVDHVESQLHMHVVD